MLKSLARIVALMLSAFPTSSDDDEAALTLAHADADLQSAILFRLEKKRSLVDAIQSTATRVKVPDLRSTMALPCSSLQRRVRQGMLMPIRAQLTCCGHEF